MVYNHDIPISANPVNLDWWQFTIFAFAMLTDMNCEFVQGFLFAKPVSQLDASILLDKSIGADKHVKANSKKTGTGLPAKLNRL